MRRWLTFDVAGSACAATLDDGHHAHALLIVSGGNEIRSGAHRGMTTLAANVAAAGHPVLRFDRRGVGDSEGENGGFEASGPDIAAAIALLRRQCPHVTRVIAFGNCDAATALLLHPEALAFDRLLVANPWTMDGPDDSSNQPASPPAAAIRARYIAKLKNPREIWRLLTGGVNIMKLLAGIKAARSSATGAEPGCLANRVATALSGPSDRPVQILIAEGDGTAQAFLSVWNSKAYAAARANAAVTIHRHPSASHGFADDDARQWLTQQVISALQ